MALTLSDMMLALGIVLLLFEVIKGAGRARNTSPIICCALVVFGAAALRNSCCGRGFGYLDLFPADVLGLVDFLSGLALRARRGVPVASGAAVSPRRGARQPAPVAAEPQFEPAPAPAVEPASSVPAAACVAEAVLMDHPEPKIAEPKISRA